MDEQTRGELLSEMLAIAGPGGERFRPLYEKGLAVLHPDLIRGYLTEIRRGLRNKGEIKDAGRMLSAMIKRGIKDYGGRDARRPPVADFKIRRLPETIQQLISEIPKNQTDIEKEKPELIDRGMKLVDYGNHFLPWPAVMGPHFFTLPGYTPKKGYDTILIPIRASNKTTVLVPLIRGLAIIGGRERWKIPDTDDERIFRALTKIWAIEGAHTLESKPAPGKKSLTLAYVDFDIKTLAVALGSNAEVGGNATTLIDRVLALKKVMYVLDGRKIDGIDPFTANLSLVGGAAYVQEGQRGRGKKTIMRVIFSEFISSYLLSGRCVSRSLDLLRLRSPIAFKIADYLEKLPKRERLDPISFRTLIERAALPPQDWHKEKARRGKKIGAAIATLNGKQVGRRHTFFLTTEERADDWYLIPGFRHILDIEETPAERQLRLVVARSRTTVRSALGPPQDRLSFNFDRALESKDPAAFETLNFKRNVNPN